MNANKSLIRTVGLVMIVGLLLASVAGEACASGNGQGTGGGQPGYQWSGQAANLPRQELSAEEKVGLTKMREEEKLARDVYRLLYEKWNHRVFKTIALSEQRHMDSVKVLLDKYGMTDPVTDSSTGVFTDPELQRLYNALLDQGRQSLVAALTVGATIEDLDIKDLYDLLAQTDNRDIKVVYQNLAKGSRNHMRTFVSQLSMRDAAYGAQFLTTVQVEDIITTPWERGRVDEHGVQVGGSGLGCGKGQAPARRR